MTLARRITELTFLAVGAGLVVFSLLPHRLTFTARFDETLFSRAVQAGLTPLGTEQVRRLVGAEKVVFVDARSREAYDQGHLPDAVSLSWPPEALPASIGRGDRIVVYCGSAYCSVGLKLGSWLRARGYPFVALYLDGFDIWTTRGQHVGP